VRRDGAGASQCEEAQVGQVGERRDEEVEILRLPPPLKDELLEGKNDAVFRVSLQVGTIVISRSRSQTSEQRESETHQNELGDGRSRPSGWAHREREMVQLRQHRLEHLLVGDATERGGRRREDERPQVLALVDQVEL